VVDGQTTSIGRGANAPEADPLGLGTRSAHGDRVLAADARRFFCWPDAAAA